MALDAILAHKRAEVAERMSRQSLEGLLAGAGRSTRSFGGALRAGTPGFVLEIKFASPSEGTIRPGGDLEPVLASYGRHADAVSVLTDARFFGGSVSDYSFAGVLSAAGVSAARITTLTDNPTLEADGERGSAFDLTEGVDAEPAATLLAGAAIAD